MSENKPEGYYVYQPIGSVFPIDYSKHPDPPIYAVGGISIDSGAYYGITKSEAERIVKELNEANHSREVKR